MLAVDLLEREDSGLLIFSLFQYGSLSKSLVAACKGGYEKSVVEALSLVLVQKFSANCLGRVCGVIPIPSKKSIAVDHAYEIGKKVAEYLNIPLCADVLRRDDSFTKSPSLAQKDKSLTDRGKIKFKVFSTEEFTKYSGKGLWLFVDDVTTSGATLVAAWKALGQPPAAGVTLASTPYYPNI